jgi:hypothetical protein
MERWSRPVGITLSLIVVVVLVAVGLSSEAPRSADLRNGRAFIQDNLWSAGSGRYAVWVGLDGTPYAGRQRPEGEEWEIVSLAELPGNPLAAPTADDEHNVYAIATDAAGGVHIAGNMHGDPLQYVRSGRSGRGGFGTWVRGPAPAAHPSVTYPAFTAQPDGSLLFWRRSGASGDGRVVVDILPPSASSWRAIGTVLDGRPSGESPYLNHIATDPRSGAIHLLYQWRSSPDATTTNDIGYARSNDGGRTWRASDGSPMRSPITHASDDTVIDTTPTGSGLINSGGLTVDAQGRPHGVVVYEFPGREPVLEHVWLDRDQWHREQLPALDISGRPQLAGTPDGRVWLLGASGTEVVAIDITPNRDPATTQQLAEVPVGWEVNYDSQALARDGSVEMLIPDGDRPHVVEAPLTGG